MESNVKRDIWYNVSTMIIFIILKLQHNEYNFDKKNSSVVYRLKNDFILNAPFCYEI